MLKLLIIFTIIVSVSGFKDRAYYEDKFFTWMMNHGPGLQAIFRNGQDFVHFLENFIQNDKYIENHNAGGLHTFTLGHNKFSHLNPEEWKAYITQGGLKSSAFRKQLTTNIHKAPVDTKSLPKSVDWITAGGVTPVKDQGACGSCWSFSTTGAIEGAAFVKYGKLISLSEQNFVDCDNFMNGGQNLGCNGGLMDDAFAWAMKNEGICSEADYPYESGTTMHASRCQQDSCTKLSTSIPISYTDVETNSDAALMSALVQQPVAIAIEADKPEFQLYKDGVFTASCGTALDHGVLVVGYGTSEDGIDYYKVKNSWGEGWGNEGYILLQRGGSEMPAEGQCGILSGPPSYPNM